MAKKNKNQNQSNNKWVDDWYKSKDTNCFPLDAQFRVRLPAELS